MITNKPKPSLQKFAKLPWAFIILLGFLAGSIAEAGSHQELETIKEFFIKGEYDRAIARQPYLETDVLDKDSLLGFYFVGMSLLKKERYAEARKIFQEILARDHSLPYADQIEMRIADSFSAEGDVEAALRKYRHVMTAFPQSAALPRAYEQAGKICQKLGLFDQAYSYFKLLEMNFPLSFEALNLRRGVTERTLYFGVEVGSFLDSVNAGQLKTELELKGFSPYISTQRDKDVSFYRVRLGHFSSRREAEILAREVESFGYSTQVFP